MIKFEEVDRKTAVGSLLGRYLIILNIFEIRNGMCYELKEIQLFLIKFMKRLETC